MPEAPRPSWFSIRVRMRVPSQNLAPLIVACALFMENLDSTILSTALPAIAAALHENPLHLNLALTSYLLSLAVFIPISGWIADRFGPRPVFQTAIGIFVLGSIACSQSSSLSSFVLARIVQGMGGAMMTPVGRIILLRSTEKSELLRAMAFVTVPALLGPLLGPPLGGFLATYVGWQWIFWINLPIGLLGVVLAGFHIGDTVEKSTRSIDSGTLEDAVESRRKFDGLGFILTGFGFGGLIFGFETLGRDLLPSWATALLLILGGMTLTLYVWHARRTAAPVIDLRLLKTPTFRAGIIGGSLFRIGIGTIPFLLPMMLQLAFGFSAFHSGMLTFAAAAGAISMKFTARPILKRFGFRTVLMANAVLSGLFIMTYGLFRPGTSAILILGLLLLGGFFRSLQFTSANALMLADIERGEMSQASSFGGIAQQLSLSLGLGVGALALHLSVAHRSTVDAATGFRGGHLTGGDFTPAFLLAGAIACASALAYRALPPDAGAAVSGSDVAPPSNRRK